MTMVIGLNKCRVQDVLTYKHTLKKKKKEAAWSMIFISKIKSALRQNQKVEFIPQI